MVGAETGIENRPETRMNARFRQNQIKKYLQKYQQKEKYFHCLQFTTVVRPLHALKLAIPLSPTQQA
jgi:hypothetical protein